ncbi:AbrB/MazE/SpoVT family DNA-binding domain-containing protein [Kurthia sibirica]|uniref:AbrB/MazE/SpoVT family DNA-binding domain-containing protein n=1 Tax=Kurthia sibirica TaxID=202750 RepID=UPI0011703DDF|nr:AbrB/MazE/SpoVT family DNA-binding domain-containing protein [Kurthia sibirica]GEK35440.1 AbrB family transcriptional regulator [Kurthia sibirica]
MVTMISEEETTMKVEISKMKSKGQITIPSTIRKSLHLSENDQLEFSIHDGKIILNPVITIPRDQEWFWTKEWQDKEREADEDIANGNVNTFTDVHESIKFLRNG